MKLWSVALCLLVACASAHAQSRVWQPASGHIQIPIWPGAAPDARSVPGPETIKGTGMAVTNVTRPTITVYAPKGKNTGAAVVVFPGGGFEILAMSFEGTEICDWLTADGITCILLKYRVPSVPYRWQCDCRPPAVEISDQRLAEVGRGVDAHHRGVAEVTGASRDSGCCEGESEIHFTCARKTGLLCLAAKPVPPPTAGVRQPRA